MWISDLKDYVIPFASLAIALSALVFSIRMNIANRRPHLIFTEEQVNEDAQHPKTGFYLRNIGLGPAFNIDIPEKYISSNSFLSSVPEIPRNIAPNSYTLCSLTDGNHRYIDQKLILVVRYNDHQGRLYQTKLSEMKHTFKRIYFKTKSR